MSGPTRQIWAVARKELRAYFGSPLALIFIGVFLAISLFVFFWVETFFARNVAEVRSLFQWMPVLMIFLVATLTMRQWSEEQRSGTFELLLTLPVQRTYLVVGKFLAVMALLVLALVLTVSLPVTVSLLGDLDWGPVIGGYLAAVLMAASYVAIGLFVSSRTDNQIVSLILTALVCGALYLVGTSGVTNFVGETSANVMRAVSSGWHFESIERGVIDLRDLVYYLSITAFFLLLNVTSLDMRRWGRGADTVAYRRNAALAVVLVAVHLVALNFWLHPLAGLRIDLTADGQFSLSDTTKDLVRNLEEPLLMRGYFSAETHPMLAPLVPQIRDLLREYEIAARGKVEAEVVDPRDDEEIEAEATRSYGIRADPFAVTERYGAGVVNSYFTVLVRYGDEFVTLGFDDLVEVDRRTGGQIDVRLRDLEYDMTRAIKRAVTGFQNQGAVFRKLEEPIDLTLFATVDMLPEELEKVPDRFEFVAGDIADGAAGKLRFQIVDPDAPGSPLTREDLLQLYGLRPVPISYLSPDSFYLHMVLEKGAQRFVVYPGGEMQRSDVREAIDSMIEEAVPGFLKTVGLWVPPPAVAAPQDPFDPFGPPPGPPPPSLSSWNLAEQRLDLNYTVIRPDLNTGRVPPEVDVLVVIAGQGMTPGEEFAIDQFLMRGGAVIVAAGNYVLAPQQFAGGFIMEQVRGQLLSMLTSYGVTVGSSFVLDPQNEPFPAQVRREIGGVPVFGLERLSYYPFWVDVRRDGMDTDSLITSNLPGLILQWVSPLEIDIQKNAARDVVTFLRSTDESWVGTSSNVNPDPEDPESGFPVEGVQGRQALGVSITGSFESFYKGRLNPFEELAARAAAEAENPPEGVFRPRPLQPPDEIPVTIEKSPDSARLVVIGSAEFLDDFTLGWWRNLSPDRYLLNLQFLENTVDWAVEDQALLALRSRGTVARFLDPIEEREQRFWEILNYGVALTALAAIGIVWYLRRRTERPMRLVDAA